MEDVGYGELSHITVSKIVEWIISSKFLNLGANRRTEVLNGIHVEGAPKDENQVIVKLVLQFQRVDATSRSITGTAAAAVAPTIVVSIGTAVSFKLLR